MGIVSNPGWRLVRSTILTERAVQPRLVPHAVGEPATGAAHGDVHDEVERLVERRHVRRAVDPRVGRGDVRRPVLDRRGEVAALEEGLVEAQLEHVVEARVDVHANELGRPLDRVRVEPVREGAPPLRPPPVGLVDAVQEAERAPVQRRAHVVDASAAVVSAACLQSRGGTHCALYSGPFPRDSMMSISPDAGQAP